MMRDVVVKSSPALVHSLSQRRRRKTRRAFAVAQIPLLASLGLISSSLLAQTGSNPPQQPVTPPVSTAAPTAPPPPPPGTQSPVATAPPAGGPAHPTSLSLNAASGRRLTSLEFHGLKTLTEETLLYYLGLQLGQPLDEDVLNRNVRTLWDRGLIDDIKVDGTLVGSDGVKLSITLIERPVIRSVDYEGLKRISKTDIDDKVATQHIRIHEGDPMNLGELQRVKIVIEDMYREKGYRFAQARYTVEDSGGNEKKVKFKVDEGDQVRIGKIVFQGATKFPKWHMRWVLSDTKESNLVWRVAKKDIYDPAKVQEDLDKLRALYKGEGYKNVSIGEPTITVTALHPNAKATKDQKRRMTITIPIDEGDRWKLGQVTMDGNKVYSDDRLLRPFIHEPDFWLKSKFLDDGTKKVEELYHNTGYIFAHIEPELVERPNHVADLVLHVTESDQFKVGRIEFQGNDRTQDKVLRREMRLIEGGFVNSGAIKNSIYKIRQLGYFKPNEEDPVEIDTNSEKKIINLLFKGTEADRTELQFGGGWSELDGFFGQFGVSTKNFLGRGEQAGAQIQIGQQRNLYDLSYTIPWWLDKPQSIGFRAFDSKLDYTAIINSAFLENAKGIVLTYGRNYGLFSQGSLAYTLSKALDQSTDTSGNVLATYNIFTSSIKPSWTYDSRNDPFEPVRGMRLFGSLEYGGGPLGGNNDFLKPEVEGAIFLPIGNPVNPRMVFAFNAQGGLIHPTSDRVLSPLEFFYLGGENSVRGFEFRSITARNLQNQPLFNSDTSAAGGDRYVQFNAEYHFILGGPFRVLAFVDGGNVYAKGFTFDLDRLRYSTGIEIRILIPLLGAPLRFIFAHNIHPLPEDSFQTFQFSIGTSF
jgi:outer membrane protein insertion porin family